MKSKSILVMAFMAVAVLTSAAQAQLVVAESTFDNDADGWTGLQPGGTTPTVTWHATGGNPGGHISMLDPSAGSIRFVAPAKFHGDMSCAFNGTISRDLRTDSLDTGGRNMGLSIYGTDQQGGMIRISNNEHMNVTNTWVTSTWTLNEAGGWIFIDAYDNQSSASNANIIQVLRNVTAIHIGAETLVGPSETTDLDNVRITCGLPEEYECEADLKWSQPPVEVYEGVINGWDEVSSVDATSYCWNCPTQCHGDADCNGVVGTEDAEIFAAAYNTSSGDPSYNPCADFDRDGDVDSSDQQIMLNSWGTTVPSDCPRVAIIADDWVCMDDRAIKDIHWWGSFKGWDKYVLPEVSPTAFHIGIWTDVQKNDPCNSFGFSHPNELIWENISDCYAWSFTGYDLDPRVIDQNEACFKFDLLLSQDEWFYQDPNGTGGTVYWLSIVAIYDPCGPDPNHPWGWKTRPHFYNDDAVRITDINDGSWLPQLGAIWKDGTTIENPPQPDSNGWDMAFVLTANRDYKELLYYWPIVPAPDPIVDDNIINFENFAIFADHWLEVAQAWPEPNDSNGGP